MRFIGLTMAKGTSHRLPRKNLLAFAGRPLVEWTLIAMKAARYLTDYFIVTDSKEIAEIADRHEVEVIWQDEESVRSAGHYGAPVCEALFFDVVGAQFRCDDVLISALPTSPCRKPEDIDVGVCKYLQEKMAHPDKEIGVATAVHRKDLQLMESVNGTLRMAVFDNQGRYLTTDGSFSVRSMGYAHAQARELPAIMAAFHAGTHYAGFAKDPDIFTHIDDEIWQQWDIDSLDDFQMCERLFLTNGLGDEAYARYRGGV